MQRERAQWQGSAQHQTTAWALRAMRTPVHRPAEAAGGLVISSPGLSRLEMRWKCLQCLRLNAERGCGGGSRVPVCLFRSLKAWRSVDP